MSFAKNLKGYYTADLLLIMLTKIPEVLDYSGSQSL